MSELPDRVRRAFDDHGSYEQVDETTYRSMGTAFDAVVEAEPAEDGRIRFDVSVTVPMLGSVTEDEMADVVEEGWYETFELRIGDVGGIARGDHEYEPSVRRSGSDIVVSASLSDIDESRGVDDVNAFITFVEGTYVQGLIPGYSYTGPVSNLLSNARQQDDSGAF